MKLRTLRYNCRGLDLRTNPLTREEGTAQEADNVRSNSSKELVNREDFTALNVPRSTATVPLDPAVALPEGTEILKMVQYKEEWILICKVLVVPVSVASPNNYRNKLYRYDKDANTVEEIPLNTGNMVDDATFGVYANYITPFDGKVSTLIDNNNLYFCSVGNGFDSTTVLDQQYYAKPSIYKYDGASWSLAGVYAQPSTINKDGGSAAPGFSYIRRVPFVIDDSNNVIFGDYGTDYEALDAGVNVVVRHLAGGNEKYPSVSCRIDSNQALSGGGGTFAVDFGALGKPQIGNKLMYVRTNGTEQTVYQFEVTAVGGSTLTIGNQKKWEVTGWETNLDNFQLDGGLHLGSSLEAWYTSTEYSSGFIFFEMGVSSQEVSIATVQAGKPLASPFEPVDLPLTTNFEDFYDTGLFYGNFPEGIRSITNYQESIVACDDSFVYFSGAGLNFSIENNSAFDTFKVGEEARGSMTTVRGNETFLMASRERGVWYISGNILTGNYRPQEYKSTEIGCSSPQGVVDLAGSLFFPSPRGFYLAMQGAQMREMSDKIEPIFVEDYYSIDPDMAGVEALTDLWREYILMYVPSKADEDEGIILLYSYYHHEWFKYSELLPKGGMLIEDREIYICDGEDIYKETADLSASTFTCKYVSNFHTLGDAGVEKKFIEVRAFTIGAEVGNVVSVRSYNNWDLEEADTDEVEDIEGIHIKRKFNGNRLYSMAIALETDSGNKIKFNGYEFTYSADQVEMRGTNE